jgi:cell division protein FtsB
MARRTKKEPHQLKRLQAQTNAIHSMNKLLFACVGLALGCVVVATYFPAQRHLNDLERKLAETEQQEQMVLREKEYHETELKAMKSDMEFLELKAMDRLNLHHPGEKIFRFKRGS